MNSEPVPDLNGVVERLFDPIMWAMCWLSYRIVLALPLSLTGWLLPYAGFYAFHGPGLRWRWSERVRDARQALEGSKTNEG